MFQKKVVEKNETHMLCSTLITFFKKKSCRLQDNVEKCGRARQETDDNMKQCTRFPYRIPKATDAHSKYVIRIAVPWQTMVARTRLNVTWYAHCQSSPCSFVLCRTLLEMEWIQMAATSSEHLSTADTFWLRTLTYRDDTHKYRDTSVNERPC